MSTDEDDEILGKIKQLEEMKLTKEEKLLVKLIDILPRPKGRGFPVWEQSFGVMSF
jgi:hypothetical protein